MDKITDPATGLDFLDRLRESDSHKGRTFDDLSDFLEQRAREQGVPIHGQFELTPLCNLDCKMCYTHLTPEQMKGRGLLTTEQWKDLMRQAYELGMYKVTLTGGECLTYSGFKELFLYLHSLGCEINVLTNGILLDESWISFFREHTPAVIQITLYGNDNASYEKVTGRRVFDTVVNNIKRITDADLPLQLAITPNAYLKDNMLDTVKLAKSLCKAVRINSALFDPREETGRSGQCIDLSLDEYVDMYRFLQEMEGKKVSEIPGDLLPEPGGKSYDPSKSGLLCGGGRSGFVITWNGNMYPCNRLTQIEALPLEEEFAVAWQKINTACNNWPRVAECDGCPYFDVCDNCAATMLEYAEPGKRPARLCERTRYMVKHGVRRIAECQ